MEPFDLPSYMAERRSRVDRALERLVAGWEERPARLRDAMAYSLLAPGKRIRPILAMAASEAVGGDPDRALAAGCAIEMVHAFSLVHDDLPAMDDDDMRRGRPTCHKVYGVATAILAGDALLAEAFSVLSNPRMAPPIPPEARLAVLAAVARAAGLQGMCGGQQMDMEAERMSLSSGEIEDLARRKTGALIRASVVTGGLAAGTDKESLGRLELYAEGLGLAFQITDDLIDVAGDAETAGKAVGKDSDRRKTTLPLLAGIDAARARAEALTAEAIEALAPFGQAAEPLRAIATGLAVRTA